MIEYVGELIDDEEFRRRIEEMHKVKEENYYFLTIDKDIMIDAGPKGNLARWRNDNEVLFASHVDLSIFLTIRIKQMHM